MKGWVIHSWRIKLVQNKIVFEIRHYNVNFENILFRWYSSQDALVWLFSYSKVGVYILEFLIRQESKHIICTWLCRRRKIVLENLKSIRNQQFFFTVLHLFYEEIGDFFYGRVLDDYMLRTKSWILYINLQCSMYICEYLKRTLFTCTELQASIIYERIPVHRWIC